MSSINRDGPDALAAHHLLSELRTRIAMQPLPYQYGVESRALESLWEIFGIAREAMKSHPGCENFAQITTDMLNVAIRPVTAKWHRAHNAGVLNSKDGSNQFRADLAELRIKLVKFSQELKLMAYGDATDDKVCPAVLSKSEIEECFNTISFGIDDESRSGIKNHTEINHCEGQEISSRRHYYGINRPDGVNAIGLALSGGGIRSATFCLGVVQVLANRNLMKDFDYLSTVSGGGYTGGLITSLMGQGKSFNDLSNPYGPDTSAIRYVRQNAKYLSSVNIWQRFAMGIHLVVGLALNWTGPLFLLSALAVFCNLSIITEPSWVSYSAIAGVLTAISILIHGLVLSMSTLSKYTFTAIKVFGGATLSFLVAQCIHEGFELFLSTSSITSLYAYLVLLIVGVPSMIRFLPVFGRPSVRRVVLRVSIITAGALAPLLAILLFYTFLKLGSQPNFLSFDMAVNSFEISGFYFLLTFALVMGIVSFFLNINLTALNRLYRDHISRTFVSTHAINDKSLLSGLNSTHFGPYHLINATVNLPTSTSRVLRDRRGDFFLLSKHWVGSVATGYKMTKDWLSNMDLATAMAISGAATTPQMGTRSRPTLSALMTLLNVRLGYWIKNHSVKRTGSPGLAQLISEMTGLRMTEKSKWLYLSDGGHIENLGLYELLRRRCKFIVCVDGESDPMSTFEGKLTLIRHAQIDLGIRMEPRLDDIRLNPESNFSKTHSHLLRVHYPPRNSGEKSEIGLMLYLKLSLTGDEAELLKRYRTMNPTFPHQSTIDQFYDEEQFEAYRQLGVHIAEGLFSPALLTTNDNPQNIEAWFKQLAENMLEPTLLQT